MSGMELMMISSAVSAVGAIGQGEQQAAQQRAAAQQAEYNATVARNNATLANQQASEQQQAQLRKFGQVQGSARAGIAQSGIGFAGTADDLLTQNQTNNQLDLMTIAFQGENQSRGLMAQADQYKYQAKVNRMNADNAETGGMLSAGASLLSGYGKYQYFGGSGIKAGSSMMI